MGYVKEHTRRTKKGVTTVKRHKRIVVNTPTQRFVPRTGFGKQAVLDNETHLRKRHPAEDADGDRMINAADKKPLNKAIR